MSNKPMSSLVLSLAAALALAACSSSGPGTAPSPSSPPAATEEAAGLCLPRQCGPRPICLANTVATCNTDTGCRWQCLPLISPI